MLGRIFNTHGKWSDFVSMEHRANDREHHGEPDFDNNLFGHGLQFQRMFKDSLGDGLCWHNT